MLQRWESTPATDLYSEDKDSTPSHHVEEEDHGFILMGRVSVKYPFSHHMTLSHTNIAHISEPSGTKDQACCLY